MRRRHFVAIAFAVLVLAGGLPGGIAAARQSVPIVNVDNQPVTPASGKRPTLDQVRGAILRGATAQKWQAVASGSGLFTATIVVRNKHTVVVEIPYSARNFSVRYKSSNNMNYENRNGVDVIHPNYNAWVQNLVSAIQAQLATL
jgi:hypothetical protein